MTKKREKQQKVVENKNEEIESKYILLLSYVNLMEDALSLSVFSLPNQGA